MNKRTGSWLCLLTWCWLQLKYSRWIVAATESMAAEGQGALEGLESHCCQQCSDSGMHQGVVY